MAGSEIYERSKHAAARTGEFVFNQLLPYIGNKRKLLGLIGESIEHTAVRPGGVFLDLFAGSGVVSRFAKKMGFRVISNDWEPYSLAINRCYVECNRAPAFRRLGGYSGAIARLNSLPPRVDWVTEHLCPKDDERYDVRKDRMFYMRKNGMRIDAMRSQIDEWTRTGFISPLEEACLLAPLLYQACYRSNTSGVFKAFHRGWGGQTATALYRIATDLELVPAVFYDNGLSNEVSCTDAAELARKLCHTPLDIAYLDPPYNQHPYGSNYHVLNSIALWDKPMLSREITRGDKSAIRKDWRRERRSPYNYRGEAAEAYHALVHALNSRFILTSYSTDGNISLADILMANIERGHVHVFLTGYKRYRVSSQRFSRKPMNVEFVLVLDTGRESDVSVDQLQCTIERAEKQVLANHRELRSTAEEQLHLFEGGKEYGTKR